MKKSFKLMIIAVIILTSLGLVTCGNENENTDTIPSTEQPKNITIDGTWFKDILGRTLILRGVNLGGSTKVPAGPNGPSHIREGFFDLGDVTYVGRPFPLEEADEHFSRLNEWGLTFVRLLVTWEGIEHDGPGQYDEEYLDYIRAIIEKAGEHGINIFIDPHQDAWSRWTGGDGAPAWILEKIGFDITKLHQTGAAVSHQLYDGNYPHMMWPTNHTKLGAATIYTLFFAGDAFAPNTKVDGLPVQEYLQTHYFEAVKQVVKRVKDLPNVVGYDSMNEPGKGFIGLPNLDAWDTMLTQGLMPTPAQAIMGSMYPQEVGDWALEGLLFVQQGTVTMNATGESIWREGFEDIWQQNGIWTDKDGEPRILNPCHFATVNGQEVDFERDFLKPFLLRYTEEIRSIDPEALIFMESGGEKSNPIPWGPDDPSGIVYAPHWYDGLTLFTKSYNPEFTMRTQPKIEAVSGSENIQALYKEYIGELKDRGNVSGMPTIIGEFGLPFNLNDGESYRTGDFELQTIAMDRYIDAMDSLLMSYTIWCYSADNNNLYGDLCYLEDFSIFSQDQQSDPGNINSGGRAIEAIVRPYAKAVAGEPIYMSFDLSTKIFKFEFLSNPSISAPTEIFVPNFQYPKGYKVELSNGSFEIDTLSQTLRIFHPEGQKLVIVLSLIPN